MSKHGATGEIKFLDSIPQEISNSHAPVSSVWLPTKCTVPRTKDLICHKLSRKCHIVVLYASVSLDVHTSDVKDTPALASFRNKHLSLSRASSCACFIWLEIYVRDGTRKPGSKKLRRSFKPLPLTMSEVLRIFKSRQLAIHLRHSSSTMSRSFMEGYCE